MMAAFRTWSIRMISPLSAFLTNSYASCMVDTLFAPLPSQDTGTASTATPSVSSTSSSSDKVTSAAIAAIQALVKGGTQALGAGQAATGAAASAYADAASLANTDGTGWTGQGPGPWDTATGTTTFMPVNSNVPVTMPTDQYLWDTQYCGWPTTMDQAKTQFYKENSPQALQNLIAQDQEHCNEPIVQSTPALLSYIKDNISQYESLMKAEQNGTVKFELLDKSVGFQFTDSAIRSGQNGIIGMSCSMTIGNNFDQVYNDSSKNYWVTGSEFIQGYVISWSKT
jgi:hypothetical protein